MNLQSYHLLTQPKSVLQVENYLYHIVFHETAGFVNPLIAREARDKFFWPFSAKKVPAASEVWGGEHSPVGGTSYKTLYAPGFVCLTDATLRMYTVFGVMKSFVINVTVYITGAVYDLRMNVLEFFVNWEPRYRQTLHVDSWWTTKMKQRVAEGRIKCLILDFCLCSHLTSTSIRQLVGHLMQAALRNLAWSATSSSTWIWMHCTVFLSFFDATVSFA